MAAKKYRRYGQKTGTGDIAQIPLLYVPSHPARELREDLERAGIPKDTAEGTIVFHSLRNTAITRVIEAGASVKEAQEFARHSTAELTMNLYARVQSPRMKMLAECLLPDTSGTTADKKLGPGWDREGVGQNESGSTSQIRGVEPTSLVEAAGIECDDTELDPTVKMGTNSCRHADSFGAIHYQIETSLLQGRRASNNSTDTSGTADGHPNDTPETRNWDHSGTAVDADVSAALDLLHPHLPAQLLNMIATWNSTSEHTQQAMMRARSWSSSAYSASSSHWASRPCPSVGDCDERSVKE